MRVFLLLTTLIAAGCLGKKDALEARYFHPRLPAPDAGTVADPGRPVRLGRVSAAPYLEARVVWRVSKHEIGFDENNRWAAPPDRMAEDALGRLAERGGVHRSEASDAGYLEIYVAAFEVDLGADQAVVSIRASLQSSESRETRYRTFEARRDADPKDMESVAQRMGEALQEVVEAIAAWVRQG